MQIPLIDLHAQYEAIKYEVAAAFEVDVDAFTYTMNWRHLDQVLTPHTCPFFPIHLYGHPAEMQPVLEFPPGMGSELEVLETSAVLEPTKEKVWGLMLKQAFASLVTIPLQRNFVCCAITAHAYATGMSC